MKTCSQCRSPAAAATLQCPNCGSLTFDEPAPAPRRPESELARLVKWSVGYLVLTFLLTIAMSLVAHGLLRNGYRDVAQGVMFFPVVAMPLVTLLMFAYYTSGRPRPFARGAVLYLAISVLVLGLHLVGALWGSFSLPQYLGEAAVTLVLALVGTGIGALFGRKKGPG